MRETTKCHSFDELDVAALWSFSAQPCGYALGEVEAGLISIAEAAPDNDHVCVVTDETDEDAVAGEHLGHPIGADHRS